MGWSRGAISTVALLNWIAMGLGSFFWGALSDRIGGRGVAVGGGFLLGLGPVLSSPGQGLWQFSLRFGFLVGFAAGGLLSPPPPPPPPKVSPPPPPAAPPPSRPPRAPPPL